MVEMAWQEQLLAESAPSSVPLVREFVDEVEVHRRATDYGRLNPGM